MVDQPVGGQREALIHLKLPYRFDLLQLCYVVTVLFALHPRLRPRAEQLKAADAEARRLLRELEVGASPLQTSKCSVRNLPSPPNDLGADHISILATMSLRAIVINGFPNCFAWKLFALLITGMMCFFIFSQRILRNY